MPKFDTDFFFHQSNWNILKFNGFLNFKRIEKDFRGIHQDKKW